MTVTRKLEGDRQTNIVDNSPEQSRGLCTTGILLAIAHDNINKRSPIPFFLNTITSRIRHR